MSESAKEEICKWTYEDIHRLQGIIWKIREKEWLDLVAHFNPEDMEMIITKEDWDTETERIISGELSE